ncbi:MAG: pyridoxal 5'-phosphate synthase glutaminase subunit PdxT [Armatimonadetes bacterium]|nr:pyridoxal 5'-phosphate synthase glutaminase subunit PdxT [Armatimonadota bacterium]
MRVGVLALQGDVAEHIAVLRADGAQTLEVRTPEELRAADALIIPGGESTTIGMLMDRYGLAEAIRARGAQGMPIFGTCAGAILLARRAGGGAPPLLGLMDIAVERNAYGRQRESFAADLTAPQISPTPLRVAFIRAPIITEVGPPVQMLGMYDGRPVLVRQGPLLAATFHPEVLGQTALHRYFLQMVDQAA